MSIEIDSEGHLVSAASATEIIPIDPDSAEYAKFVTVVSRRGGVRGSSKQDYTQIPRSYEALPQGHKFFCTDKELLDYCKHKGVMLFCSRPGEIYRGSPIILKHSDKAQVAECVRGNHEIAFVGLFGIQPSFEQLWSDSAGGLTHSNDFACFVSHTLLNRIFRSVEDKSELGNLLATQVTRTFVYVDVSEFSQHPVGHQLIVITSLIDIVNKDHYRDNGKVSKAMEDLEASLCIGDGYIYVFRTPSLATFFAAFLATYIEHLIPREKLIPFHYRIAAHSGPVFRFWDKGPNKGAWNYVGKGITDGQRVLDAIGPDKDDVVYISNDTRSKIIAENIPESAYNAVPWLQNRGRHKDKHGERRRLYEVDHSAWMHQLRESMTMIFKPKADA